MMMFYNQLFMIQVIIQLLIYSPFIVTLPLFLHTNLNNRKNHLILLTMGFQPMIFAQVWMNQLIITQFLVDL